MNPIVACQMVIDCGDTDWAGMLAFFGGCGLVFLVVWGAVYLLNVLRGGEE